MFGKLLAAFILIPFLEMMILIKLGELFGFFSALALIVVTGFAGALAARIQGVKTWAIIQSELQAGRLPAEEMIDGLLIFVAGILLITPGLLTDMAGLLMLVPPTRYLLKRWLRTKFDQMLRRPGGDGLQYRFFTGG